MDNIPTKKTEQGQVLLIIILVMVVSLTVGLSVVTRSITNLRVSTEEENSQRAFYAAEAGVERALDAQIPIIPPGTPVSIVGSPQTLPDNFSKIERVTIQEDPTQDVLLDKFALKDEASSLWLVDDPQNPPPGRWNGVLTFYWGRSTTPPEVCDSAEANNAMAAIEIIVVNRDAASNKIATHYVSDPCPIRRGYNHFDASSNGIIPVTGSYSTIITGMTFRYSAAISGINHGMLVQAVPLYANTPIAVHATGQGGQALPAQGRRIESVGSSGGTQHKIIVMEGNPKFPTEFFPYLILSPL